MSASGVFAALVVVTTVAAQGLPAARPEEIGLLPSALEQIAPEMQTYVDDGRVAGMVMMIARHGKVGYVKALGYSNLEFSPWRRVAL